MDHTSAEMHQSIESYRLGEPLSLSGASNDFLLASPLGRDRDILPFPSGFSSGDIRPIAGGGAPPFHSFANAMARSPWGPSWVALALALLFGETGISMWCCRREVLRSWQW